MPRSLYGQYGLFLSGLVLASPLPAEEPSPTYWQDIRPLLTEHCTGCHRQRHRDRADISGGLVLDTMAALRQSNGQAMLKRLRSEDVHRRMPLDAKPLAKAQIEMIARWLAEGLPEGKRSSVRAPVTADRRLPPKLDVVLPTRMILPRKLSPNGKDRPVEMVLPVGPLDPVTTVTYHPEGRILAAGQYGQVTLWDLQQGQPQRVITAGLLAVHDLAFSPDGRWLAIAGGRAAVSGTIHLIEWASGRLRCTLRGHDDVVAKVAFSPDSGVLVSASYDQTLVQWDLAANRQLRRIEAHSAPVVDVAFAPNGTWYVSASQDRTLRVFDRRSGNCMRTLAGMTEPIFAVAVRPDGQRIVSSGRQSELYWWDARTGKSLSRQIGHDVAVFAVAFDRQGEQLISAGADRTLRQWRADSGDAIRRIMTSHANYTVALRPDGKQIASGGSNGLVQLWDARSGQEQLKLLSIPTEKTSGKDEKGTPRWLALTHKGFIAGRPELIAEAGWRVAGATLDATILRSGTYHPKRVRMALHGKPTGFPFDRPPAGSIRE